MSGGVEEEQKEQEEDEKEVEEHKKEGEVFHCSSTVSVFRISEAAVRR